TEPPSQVCGGQLRSIRQKVSRAPSWIWRGTPLALVIWPKVVEAALVTKPVVALIVAGEVSVGDPRLTTLKALVASARNCNWVSRYNLNVRKMPRSMSLYPGVRSEFRDRSPSAPPGPIPPGIPGPFWTNAAVLTHSAAAANRPR